MIPPRRSRSSKSLNVAFLTNAIYRFRREHIRPIWLNPFQSLPNFPVPSWYLVLSNRMTCLISEGTNIIDFVILNDNLDVDLTAALLSGRDVIDPTPTGIRGVWSTNRIDPRLAGSAANTGPTDGILKQIDISADLLPPQYSPSAGDWLAFTAVPITANDREKCHSWIQGFSQTPPTTRRSGARAEQQYQHASRLQSWSQDVSGQCMASE